jgi:hypothetical protein
MSLMMLGRHTHVAEPLVPEPSTFRVEIAVTNLRGYKLPYIDWILTELIQAGGNSLHSDTHKLLTSVWNKEELAQQWKRCVIVHVYKKG